MRLITSVTVLLFVLSVGLSAQSTTEQETVSKSDLKGVTEQMRSELRRLDKKAVERDVVMKEEARRQNEELVRKNAEAQEKISSQLTKAEEDRKHVETERERKSNNLIYGMAGVGLLIALACGVMLVRRPVKTVDVRVVQDHQKEDKGVLINPKSDELKKYSLDNNMNPAPALFKIREREKPVFCEVKIVENKKPLIVKVEGKTSNIGWDGKEGKIAEFLGIKTQEKMPDKAV